jgi:hypothetical protein
MKTMKFLAAVILSALVFVGCDPVEPEGPTMHKGPIVVNWGNASDVNGKTFDVGMDNWDAEMYQMVVHMMLKNTTSEDKTFTLKETRKYDVEKASSTVCVTQCMSGKPGEVETEWPIGKVKAGETLNEGNGGVSIDLAPMVEEATMFTADFVLTDGVDEVKFTINYHYTPVVE